MNWERRTKLKPRKKRDHHWLGVVLDLIRHFILRTYIYVENKVFEQF